MPGGLFGSIGSTDAHPPIYAVVAVYGGMILLVRVWIGLLRHLSSHRGVPVRRVVVVVVIWALPLLLAPPLFSRDVYSYAGQGEMVSHHIDPYVYGTGVLGSTPFSTMPDSMWTNTPSPYGPTFLSIDGLLDKASGHKILPDILLLRLLEVAGLALIVGGHALAGPPPGTGSGAAPSSSAPAVPWCWPRSSGGRTTRRSCSACSWRVSPWPSGGAPFPASSSARSRPG